MVFNHTYRIGLEDCGKENEATNKAILTILEDIAGFHSATVGLGLNEINKTGCAWVILKWQVQIIKRPEYNEMFIHGQRLQISFLLIEILKCLIIMVRQLLLQLHDGYIWILTKEDQSE